jgi:response regulator RpfG family c-di-GMP phosphodiesterase
LEKIPRWGRHHPLQLFSKWFTFVVNPREGKRAVENNLIQKNSDGPMRILVVEDEKKVAKFIQQGLEEEHYAVDVAHDGEKGLQMATAENYDLLVLDVNLPKMNGLDLIKSLRA